MLGLRAKLSASYIFLALVCILLISVLANIFLEKQFQVYVRKNMVDKNKQIVTLLSQQYDAGNWNQGNIMEIGMHALEQGMIVKLQDAGGWVVWDATVHNNGLCQQMITHMAQNMVSRYPNWKGGYVKTRYPITKNFQAVGAVEIGYYGPYYFNDTDLAFINTLNQLLAGVTVLALILALILGGVMAKRLSHPIAKVINTAQQIATGNLEARSHEKTGVREINQLTTTVNELAAILQQQELLRKRLTADVAHELRTPLATLQSHIEAMLDGIWKADPQRLRVCYDEIMRVNRMVADLEKLTKYESEQLELVCTTFDVTALIRQLTINFENEFIQQGVSLQLFGEPTTIVADRDKISQIMINLISNGLKFTPAGGRVDIHVSDLNQGVEIRVMDNGAGIASEDLPFIFERFYRADQSRSRITGGSGIGLTIVKALIEAHHGQIEVKSQVGGGTEFILFILSSK